MFRQSFRHNHKRIRFFGRKNNYRGNGHQTHVSTNQYISKTEPQNNIAPTVIKHQFADFSLDQKLKQNITEHGYSTPTPIQDQAILPILEGKDVVGIANTGTGKTAAFLIPLIQKIIHSRAEKILIIVPTRELAAQINDELKAFTKYLFINSAICIGGVGINGQIMDIRRNPNIIIGTPGRLKELITKRFLPLGQYKTVVLDEVDRMLDIGFIHDIKYIISLLPQDRQSLFFSATVSQEINSIIQSFVKNPLTISVKVTETVRQIDQDIIRVKDKNEKIAKLQSLLRLEDFKKVLVFGRTKWGVERLFKTLQQNGFSVASIHGNKSQNQRLRALSLFRQNQLQVLVATDVVARGLDILDVTHVINFDEPSTYTDYVHRIGRTGRANKSGKALTFVI